MAVRFDEKQEKLIIEIDTNKNNASSILRSRKLAILDIIGSVEEDTIKKDTIYWLLELVQDLEFSEDQYNHLIGIEPNKVDPKANWVKNEIPQAIAEADKKEFVKLKTK